MADLNRIQFKRTSTAGRKPDASILTPGELAINLADRELFTKDDSNNVITLGDFRGELPTDANLDNYGPTGKFTGIWSKSTSTNARPTHKFPEENAIGVLEVFVAGQFAGTQRYTTRYGNIFIRSLTAKWNGTNGPWSPWRNVQAGTRPLSTTIDLNDLGDASHFGLWRNSSDSIATLERNFPEAGSAAQGLLEVFEGGTYSRTQRYTTRYGVVYTRCLAAAWDAAAPNWGPWQQVGHGTPATFYDGDLNNFKTPGLYNILGTDQVINCPTGEGLPAVIVGLLEVKQRASGGAIFQKFTTSGTGTTTRGRIFERAMTNNIWGAWNEVYTSYSMPITLGIGGVKTQLTDLDWQTFNFVPGAMYCVPLNKMTNMPANMDWGTIDGNLIMLAVGPSEHTGTGRTVQVWRGTVSQANYRYFVVRIAGNPGSRTNTCRRVVLEDGRHKWTAQQDFNGAVNFGAPTNFNSTVNLNNTTTFKTEVKFRSLNAFRMYGGKFGTIFRNDGESLYILSTDENDQDGNFNTNRPFRYELRTGDVTLGGTSGANVLKLKRDSLTAFFGGDINLSKGYLTFEAGRLYSRDYFRFNHWGDSNNARDNIIQLEDSQGAHFSTERQMSNGAIKTKFFGDVETTGRIDTTGNITTTGPDITIKRTGNKHIYFRDLNSVELGLIYCDDAGAIRFRGQKQAQVWSFADKTIRLESGTCSGEDKGLIRGQVQGGGWVDWRSRSAGLLVDCQVSENSAHNVWKATHWGKYHIAAMGVHVPGGNIGNALVRLHVNDTNFDFNAAGDLAAGRNGSFNDVYIRSDSRLKINKEEYKENATDKVNNLKVYSYDKVKSLTDRSVIAHEVGIIAQDLEKELPEAVTTSNIGDPDKPEEILTISNSAVNALLIKAFQEMSERLKKAEAKLAALEKN